MEIKDYKEQGIKKVMSETRRSPNESYPLNAKFPKNLMIELTNACTLKCVMCYNRFMKREKGFMSEETYRKVLNQAKEIGIEMIGLYTTGESFLHPKIYEFIRLAKDMGFKYVYITSNGTLLNEENIQKILNSGLDSIKFSIDAGSKEVYEKLRVGGDFNKLYKDLKLLRKIRDERCSDLKIYASFVITNKNVNELKKFKEVWKGIIDEVSIGFVGNQSNLQSKEFNELAIDIVKEKMRGKEVGYCNLLWNRIIVMYDGKFTICSEDFEADLTYGDINKEPMKEAWNNDKMKAYRNMFKTKDFKLSPRCKTCHENIDGSEFLEAL